MENVEIRELKALKKLASLLGDKAKDANLGARIYINEKLFAVATGGGHPTIVEVSVEGQVFVPTIQGTVVVSNQYVTDDLGFFERKSIAQDMNGVFYWFAEAFRDQLPLTTVKDLIMEQAEQYALEPELAQIVGERLGHPDGDIRYSIQDVVTLCGKHYAVADAVFHAATHPVYKISQTSPGSRPTVMRGAYVHDSADVSLENAFEVDLPHRPTGYDYEPWVREATKFRIEEYAQLVAVADLLKSPRGGSYKMGLLPRPFDPMAMQRYLANNGRLGTSPFFQLVDDLFAAMREKDLLCSNEAVGLVAAYKSESSHRPLLKAAAASKIGDVLPRLLIEDEWEHFLRISGWTWKVSPLDLLKARADAIVAVNSEVAA